MEDKYFYEISWSWHEDYVSNVYYSEKDYTHQELEIFVNEAIKKCFADMLGTDKYIGFTETETIFNYIDKFFRRYEIYPLMYTAKVNYFGMYIIDKDLSQGEEERLKLILGEELLFKIREHNNKIEEEMFKIVGEKIRDV